MKKLSWSEPQEIDTLDKALIHLGFTFYIDTIPGIKGECYVITNYKGSKEGTFVIKVDDSFLSPVYNLYQLIPRWETNFGNLSNLTRELKHSLKFFGN